MKEILIIIVLTLTALSISAQPNLTHHYDITGAIHHIPDDTGYYLETDLGYKFKFIQEIAFTPFTWVHIVGITIDSCTTIPDISQCIQFESINQLTDYPQYGTCCEGIQGDVNGDGLYQTDISDLLYFIDYMFVPHGIPPPCLGEVDLVHDDNMDISDLLKMVDIMFDPIYAPSGFPLCPVDTVQYLVIDDTLDVNPEDTVIYTFYFNTEDQLIVEGLGVTYEGFYKNHSMIYYNFDLIDAQTVVSATERGEWITGYMELYSIAGPVYKKIYFKKL